MIRLYNVSDRFQKINDKDGISQMESINLLFKQDITSLIPGIFIIMSAVIAITSIIGKFSEIIGKPVRWIRKKNQDHDLLIQTIQNLATLQQKQEHDANECNNYNRILQNNISDLNQKVDSLSTSIFEMRKIQDKDKLAEYKDKIGDSYRYYNERKYSDETPVPYWNHMEKESLEGLISQYEAHGGKNSFVHSVVEPEMQTWKVID